MPIDPALLPEVPAAADPEVPTVDLSGYPAWLREPAKLIGWLVTAVLLLASGVTFVLSPDVLDVLPESWKPYVRTASIAVAAAALIAGRVQTWLTRNGLGKAGNGIDGVWSPAAVDASQKEVAARVAAAKGAAPETHAK